MIDLDDNPYRAPSVRSIPIETARVEAESPDDVLRRLRLERQGFAKAVGILSFGGGLVTAIHATFTALDAISSPVSPWSAVVIGAATTFSGFVLASGVAAYRGREWGLSAATIVWTAWLVACAARVLWIVNVPKGEVAVRDLDIVVMAILAGPGLLAIVLTLAAWRLDARIRKRVADPSA